MKRLVNYFRSLKALEVKVKKLDKDLIDEAKSSVALKSFLTFLPIYLILFNLLIMFIGKFYVLIFILNVFIFLNIYFYQYNYYKYLMLNKHLLSSFKTVLYGIILTIIIWVIAYIIGGFL